jgi:hypothetical protein
MTMKAVYGNLSICIGDLHRERLLLDPAGEGEDILNDE